MEHNIIVPRLSTLFIQDGSNEINIIEKLVTNHDIQYKSINFGEDVIKEMIMSSVFGIPVSAKVLYYDIIIWPKYKYFTNLYILMYFNNFIISL